MYGTATPVISRRSRSGRMSKLREKKPEMMMKAGMWNEYTTVYAASRTRLSPLRGSQAWPTATSTIARYLALSKNASRCLPDGAGRSPLRLFVRGLGTPGAGDCAGGSGVLRLPYGRCEFVTDPPGGDS